MAYALGVALFALGILVAVCLHEAGHMFTAKAFGMKVTRYFVGFGPTLWSTRRGETEYGIKAVPAGGFVKIVGMTPLEDEEEVGPADKDRVFWRKPLWQRTIVLAAGSATHFILGFALLWAGAVFVGMPNASGMPGARAEIGGVQPCVVTSWELVDAGTANERQRGCQPGDPVSPASQAGLRSGDVVTAVNGERVADWETMVEKIRPRPGQTLTVTYERDGTEHTTQVTPAPVQRPKIVDNRYTNELETVGALGIQLEPLVTVGPLAGVGAATWYTKQMFVGTFQAMAKFPEKIPKLFSALAGEERDPETPISVVGASRLGGETVQYGVWALFILMMATLNFFIGIFNLLPLLPLDGGHIAIAWFEKARSWLYARLGRPDPGRVDYLKLMPVTWVVIIVFGAFTVLTVAADIVNPIEIFR